MINQKVIDSDMYSGIRVIQTQTQCQCIEGYVLLQTIRSNLVLIDISIVLTWQRVAMTWYEGTTVITK